MVIGPFFQRCRTGLYAAAVFASVVVLFHRAAFTDQIFFSRDIQRVYYPLKRYWAERVLHGEFPQWFPYDALGQPFIGMVISGAFHPSNLLYLLLPLGTALKLNVLLCYPVAFFGAYFLARRCSLSAISSTLGAVLFAFNGYMISVTNNLLYLTAAATLPWALWAADRFFAAPTALRALVGASLLALILFAGDAQSFALCIPSIALLLLMRHRSGNAGPEVKALGCLIGLGLLISAIQIVPALKILPETVTSLRRLDSALLWSMHPMRLLELIWGPLFGGEPGTSASMAIDRDLLKTGMTTLWVESVHLGVPAVFLALAAWWIHRRSWQAWCLMLSGVLLLTLIFGKFAGLYALVFKLLPLWRSFRYPEKMLPLLLLLLSISAGIGLERALRNGWLSARLSRLLWIAGAATSLAFFAEWADRAFSKAVLAPLWSGAPPAEAMSRIHDAFLTATARSSLVSIALGGLLIGVARRPRLGLAIPALCFLELSGANEPFYDLTFPSLLQTPTAFVSALEKKEGPAALGKYRVVSAIQEHHVPVRAGLSLPDGYAVSVASALLPDIPALWGIESADAYLPAESKRVYRLTQEPMIWYLRFDADFGTRYTVLPNEFFEQVNGRRDLVVMRHPALHLILLENPSAAPRAALRRAHCVGSEQEAFRAVISRSFDPAREAVLECGGHRSSSNYRAVPLDEARIDDYAPEHIEITAQNASPALLVLNDAAAQGWTAKVDGKVSEIFPANYAVRGIELQPGRHKILLTYRTPGLFLGLGITCSALFSVLGTILFRRFWAVRSQKTSPWAIPATRQ